MPSQYEVDTTLVKILVSICLVMGIFSLGFVTTLASAGLQIRAVMSLEILFMMLFTLLLGVTVGLFIKWLRTYKTSLLGYLR